MIKEGDIVFYQGQFDTGFYYVVSKDESCPDSFKLENQKGYMYSTQYNLRCATTEEKDALLAEFLLSQM